MIDDETQLLTPTEAADLKGMSLNAFKYRASKPPAPQPVIIGSGHVFYRRDEVMAWKPTIHKHNRGKKQ